MPSPTAAPAKLPAKSGASKRAAPQQPADLTKMLYGVAAVLVVGILLAVAPTGGEDPVHQELLDFFADIGIKRRGVTIRCRAPRDCYVAATSALRPGEAVLKYPKEAIISQESIMESPLGEIIRKDNATILMKHVQEAQLFEGFVNIFVYALFLVQERRAGAASPFAGWLRTLPKEGEQKGALFWDEARDKCLDAQAAAEAEALRRSIGVFVKIADELCASDERACPHGVPTESELRWAAGTYLATNYQDQAILPGFEFLRVNNDRDPAAPRWNAEDSTLDIRIGDGAKKGEEITTQFARGPSMLLTSRGFFDRTARGVEARLRLPDRSDTFLKARCNDRFDELMFAGNGRPREALIECVAALVANPAQRRNFRKWRTDVEHNMNVWGNLTGMAQHGVDSFKDYDESQCTPTDDISRTFFEYVTFTRGVLVRNYAYALEQHKRAVEAYQRVFPVILTESNLGGDDAPESP